MRPKILSVYILDKNNSPIFREEFGKDKLFMQDLKIIKIVETLEKFASELDDKLSSVVIDEFKYFYGIDAITETKFIIRTEKDVSEKQFFPIMKKVKNIYINEFLGVMPNSKKEKRAFKAIQQRFVSEVIEYEPKLDVFLKSI